MRAFRSCLGVEGEGGEVSRNGLDGLGERGLAVERQVAVGLVLAAGEIGQEARVSGVEDAASGGEEDEGGDEPVEDGRTGLHGLFIPQDGETRQSG